MFGFIMTYLAYFHQQLMFDVRVMAVSIFYEGNKNFLPMWIVMPKFIAVAIFSLIMTTDFAKKIAAACYYATHRIALLGSVINILLIVIACVLHAND